MYHHRGAYLQSLAMALHMELDSDSVYLWTLPMFHCNGWCFTWAVTAVGGVICACRSSIAAAIWRHMRESGVTPFLRGADRADDDDLGSGRGQGKAAAPGARSAPVARRPRRRCSSGLAELGMDVTHLYGLTETYGPSVLLRLAQRVECRCRLPEQARLKSRQGVGNVICQRDPRRRRRGRRRARRTRDDGRDRDPRQQRDARLLPATTTRRARPAPTAGSAPAISA